MITNFTPPDFENGQTILERDLDSIFGQIHTVIGALIADNDRAILLPAGFDGVNSIETPSVENALIMVDASKRATVRPLSYFDDAVNNCGEQSVLASTNASAANDSHLECLSLLEQCQAILAQVQTIRAEVVAIAGGASAYDVAVINGFVGTQAQWLTTLVGASAYQVAVNNGFVGTQAQWLASLKGVDGDLTEALLPTTDAYKNLETLAIAGL
jgi:hypothetical protein